MTQLFCDLYKHHGTPKIKKKYFEVYREFFFAVFRNSYAFISLATPHDVL